MRLPNVQFLPMQPRQSYPAVLHASDVSLATLHDEVSTPVVPSKLLSIMAAGLPVVACMRVDGDAPRLIADARCGFALPPEDAQALASTIVELCENAGARAELGGNGRRYAEQHLSVGAGADLYLDLFGRLVPGKADAPSECVMTGERT